MERLPIEPLYQALDLDEHDLEGFCVRTGGGRWVPAEARYRGGLSYYMADKLAVGAGFHPFEVWPELLR